MSFDRPGQYNTGYPVGAPTGPADQYRPETAYNQSFDQAYGWQNSPKQSHQQLVPQPYATPNQREIKPLDEATKQRRAATVRMATALALAIPLTSIAVDAMSSAFSNIIAMVITWVGIAVVVALSTARFPPRQGQ